MLRDGQELRFTNHAGQPWMVSWHPPAPPPPGNPHGSAAICRSHDDKIVLVSADRGKTCYFPGGRPEGNEDWRETLEREVYEEACARVFDATLLGYSRGTCLGGPEEGLILVRGLWVADVSLEPWEPDHEMTDRILVHADEVLKRIQVDQGMGPLVRRWVSEALGPAAIPQDGLEHRQHRTASFQIDTVRGAPYNRPEHSQDSAHMLKVRPGPDPYVFYKMHHVEEVAYRQDDVLRARVQLA